MTPAERAATIHALLADGRVVTDGTLTVTASDASVTGGAVTVTLAAVRDGVPVALANPFVFVNPPVAIRDGDAVVLDAEAALDAMLLGAV